MCLEKICTGEANSIGLAAVQRFIEEGTQVTTLGKNVKSCLHSDVLFRTENRKALPICMNFDYS